MCCVDFVVKIFVRRSPNGCQCKILSFCKWINTQWFPMCQFRFENYHTKIRVQIQNFYEIIHLQLFSSHCPDFQPFWAISGIFVDFCRLVPYDFVGIQSPKTMWGLSRPAKFITWKSCVLVSYWNPESFRKNQEGP